jgi:hypothetical protein
MRGIGHLDRLAVGATLVGADGAAVIKLAAERAVVALVLVRVRFVHRL